MKLLLICQDLAELVQVSKIIGLKLNLAKNSFSFPYRLTVDMPGGADAPNMKPVEISVDEFVKFYSGEA